MSAVSAFKSLSVADGCLTSLPSILTTNKSQCPFRLSSRPLRLDSLKAQISIVPLKNENKYALSFVVRTSDRTRAAQVEEEELFFKQEDVAEASVSDWGGENEAEFDGEDVGESDEKGGFEKEESYPEPPEGAKLFVGNLPYDVDSEQLAQIFEKAGIVEVSEVIYSRETDQSRGFGFVTMSTVQEAEKAVELFHRYRTVTFASKLDRSLARQVWDTTVREGLANNLHKMRQRAFEHAGDMGLPISALKGHGPPYISRQVWDSMVDEWSSEKWQRRSEAGRRNRAAHPEAHLHTSGSASFAATKDRMDMNGRLLTVNKASPKGSRIEKTPREFQLYVGNLPWQVDNARLEQVFSEHGKVVYARVVCDRESGRSRGFGFVTMSSKGEIADAIAAFDGQILDGRALRVNVAEERSRRM